jgi:type IV secretory pathway VirJ component
MAEGGRLSQPPTLIPPEIDQIQAQLMECYYSDEDKRSACADLATQDVNVVQISGGHHFDGDYRRLEMQILSAFSKRTETDGLARARQEELPDRSAGERYASAPGESP